MHPKRYKGKNKKRSQSEFPPTEHSHVWTVVINMLSQQASDLKQNKNDKIDVQIGMLYSKYQIHKIYFSH